jgi:hypothetical protein
MSTVRVTLSCYKLQAAETRLKMSGEGKKHYDYDERNAELAIAMASSTMHGDGEKRSGRAELRRKMYQLKPTKRAYLATATKPSLKHQLSNQIQSIASQTNERGDNSDNRIIFCVCFRQNQGRKPSVFGSFPANTSSTTYYSRLLSS